MKKLALTAVATLVASLGTVSVGSGAQAADPYPGFVPTNCRVKVDHNSGKRRTVRIMGLVEVPSSRAHPKGLVRVTVKKSGGEVIFHRSFDSATGNAFKFFGPKWAKSTKYTAKVSFVPLTGSVFLGCERQARFAPKKK
jgi:hypothetical protein